MDAVIISYKLFELKYKCNINQGAYIKLMGIPPNNTINFVEMSDFHLFRPRTKCLLS